MKLLHQYVNGNTRVLLYDDGTKHREYHNVPQPQYPESIDVKITNYCDAGCNFCHEQSTIEGKHGDLTHLAKVLSVLPPGVEIAVGGGNPLAHPELESFLIWAKKHGLVVNMTINQKHLAPFRDQIVSLIRRKLIHGVGISWSADIYLKDVVPIIAVTDNVVFHVIMGINSVDDISVLSVFCQLENKPCKVLVLGYKMYGFGLNYYLRSKRIENVKYQWYTQLAKWFRHQKLTLSFDNLAIEQLKLRRYFTDEAWQKFYMGDDFVFTMYMDAVEQTYAASSTSPNRTSFQQCGLLEYFQANRKK